MKVLVYTSGVNGYFYQLIKIKNYGNRNEKGEKT